MSKTKAHNHQKKDDDGDGGGGGGGHDSKRSTGRKLAEWVTLGVSILLVLGVAGYLAYHAISADDPYVPVRVTPALDQARDLSGGQQFVLPVRIQNFGSRTIKDFQAELRWRSPSGREETRQFKIDYLGEHSAQEQFIYLDDDPRTLGIRARPLQYSVD